MKKGTEIRPLKETAVFLEKSAKEHKAPIWLAAARYLSKARRRRIAVSLGHVAKVAKSSTIIVPGKLLSGGKLEKPLVIAAMAATGPVRQQIQKSGAKLISIRDVVKLNPKGTGVQLVI